MLRCQVTTTTRDLAGRAQAIARKSEGLARTAANCVMIALTYSPSAGVARDALGQLAQPDVREAALALLDELSSEEQSATAR
jgi:hypothetical protein